MSAHGVLLRCPRVLWRRTLSRVLLTHAEEPDVVVLSGAAGELWEALIEPASFDEVVDVLGERYGVPAGRVREDLQPVVEDLQRRHLLLDGPG